MGIQLEFYKCLTTSVLKSEHMMLKQWVEATNIDAAIGDTIMIKFPERLFTFAPVFWPLSNFIVSLW